MRCRKYYTTAVWLEVSLKIIIYQHFLSKDRRTTALILISIALLVPYNSTDAQNSGHSRQILAIISSCAAFKINRQSKKLNKHQPYCCIGFIMFYVTRKCNYSFMCIIFVKSKRRNNEMAWRKRL